VLIVEDEKDISDLMCLHLERDGFEVETADNGEKALSLLKGRKYGLLVLDWMLPGLSGLELCKRIRSKEISQENASLPILMVTARSDSSDIVVGLEMGADDYLIKPFDIPVLLARVRALARRSAAKVELGRKYRLGQLLIDVDGHKVFCGKTEISLTPSEFKLMAALSQNEGRVLTRERLIDLVQGQGVNVVDRAVDTHIFGLRKKLGKCSELVETVRGIGYRIKTET